MATKPVKTTGKKAPPFMAAKKGGKSEKVCKECGKNAKSCKR